MSETDGSILEEMAAALDGEEPPEARGEWRWRGPTAENGKPMVELPRDGRPLSAFAADVGEVLAHNGVWLREGVPVVLDPVQGLLTELDADCLRTYAEKSLLPAKWKKKEKDEPGQLVCSSMSREQARGILRSHHFLSQQRVVTLVSEVPVPVMRKGGGIELLEGGWDESTGILVVEGKS